MEDTASVIKSALLMLTTLAALIIPVMVNGIFNSASLSENRIMSSCTVVRWEKMYYYASESDDSVEVCLQSGQTQGIAHAFSSTSPAHGM